ncbi:unnamed protein product [Cuscuta campestris]|uniref:Uncharacterized protein n=1 Tax=Cuscuta campestris TaxID=132261 RepID=A0A484L8A0_9ASTE|nr:unnamed protein product [Cuscuta campestris]
MWSVVAKFGSVVTEFGSVATELVGSGGVWKCGGGLGSVVTKYGSMEGWWLQCCDRVGTVESGDRVGSKASELALCQRW